MFVTFVFLLYRISIVLRAEREYRFPLVQNITYTAARLNLRPSPLFLFLFQSACQRQGRPLTSCLIAASSSPRYNNNTLPALVSTPDHNADSVATVEVPDRMTLEGEQLQVKCRPSLSCPLPGETY